MALEIHYYYMYMSYYNLYVKSKTNLALKRAPGPSVSLSGTVSLTSPWLQAHEIDVYNDKDDIGCMLSTLYFHKNIPVGSKCIEPL